MSVPNHLHYSDQHEWVDALSGPARVGITDFAADALGDIVYVELPEVGASVHAGEPCGEIESTKSVSEIYAPVSGIVTARNEAVLAEPGLLNSDPYGAGWLFALDITQTPTLLSSGQYQTLIGGTR